MPHSPLAPPEFSSCDPDWTAKVRSDRFCLYYEPKLVVLVVSSQFFFQFLSSSPTFDHMMSISDHILPTSSLLSTALFRFPPFFFRLFFELFSSLLSRTSPYYFALIVGRRKYKNTDKTNAEIL